MKQKKTARQHLFDVLLWICSILISFTFVVHPIATVIIYESIFGFRYTTPDWMVREVSEYAGLTVERSDFAADGETLAGYKYAAGDTEKKGVVVLAHGMGGGHAAYLPLIACFAENGYYVFAYDVRGNDNSTGDAVEGLPQGVIDLDHALSHAYTIPEYSGLPFVLFGHSWGAYSAGAALDLHPEIQAAALVSGFNASEDMLLYRARGYVGEVTAILLPYVTTYERLKFGSEITDLSVIGSVESSDARVLFAQSADDTTVPTAYGYDLFYAAFGGSDRIEFVLYEDRGHTNLLYSEAAEAHREAVDTENIDPQIAFELNEDLMAQILSLYDVACGAK